MCRAEEKTGEWGGAQGQTKGGYKTRYGVKGGTNGNMGGVITRDKITSVEGQIRGGRTAMGDCAKTECSCVREQSWTG